MSRFNDCRCRDTWAGCSLCRSNRTCLATYQRVKSRPALWPQSSTNTATIKDRAAPMRLEEAYLSVMQSLYNTSIACEDYHRSSSNHNTTGTHYVRYHSSSFKPANSCDVHMTTSPGSYSITATSRKHGEVIKESKYSIKLEPGQTASLTFNS